MNLLIALALAACALPQDGAKKPPGGPPVDQSRIDAAIAKGLAWLQGTNSSPKHVHAGPNSDELILLTLIHGGTPPSDAKYQRLLNAILASKLEGTYKVALQAMCLEEIGWSQHQARIWQCAQFLVDNQCKNGQWSYGDPTIHAATPPALPKDVATSARPGGLVDFGATTVKTKVTRRITVKKQKEGPGTGDNSNTQYAALGLRACHDGGIDIQEDVVHLAIKWWRESQHKSTEKDNGYGGVRGWNYKTEGNDKGREAYGSMTAGAVGALCIYDYMLKRDWKRDPHVLGGMGWLAANYTVSDNPKRPDPKDWHLYYLYALERAGILYDTEKIGQNFWYADGAKWLLEHQEAGGSWKGAHEEVWNTCFAILFLKRATKYLDVASGEGPRKKP